MPVVKIGNRKKFDVELVVFDKDGTLIDFHVMWGRRATAAVNAVLDELGYDAQLECRLYETLGYRPSDGATNGSGPLAIAPLHKIDVAMSTVLYQHGLAWADAERTICEKFSPHMCSDPTDELVKPLGAVEESIKRLNAYGIRTAIATSDNRISTLKMLRMLNIADRFDVIFCGDDDLPQKPSAEVLQQIGARCSVSVEEIMMVGDTVNDLSMAHTAKAGAKVGVIGGATPTDLLSDWCDALISSIDELGTLE